MKSTETKELKALTEMRLAAPISDDHFREALAVGSRKLEWIISREGDHQGQRREALYLAELIVEYVHDRIITEVYLLQAMAKTWEKALRLPAYAPSR